LEKFCLLAQTCDAKDHGAVTTWMQRFGAFPKRLSCFHLAVEGSGYVGKDQRNSWTLPLIRGMIYGAWTTNDLATTRPLYGGSFLTRPGEPGHWPTLNTPRLLPIYHRTTRQEAGGCCGIQHFRDLRLAMVQPADGRASSWLSCGEDEQPRARKRFR
jgi:hypothetical protein